MRPRLVVWLAGHGLPAWLAPEYFQLASIAALLGSAIALHLARRDGASRRHTAYAIACAYVGALVGGYLFEALRAVPIAVVHGSWGPIRHPGRAAYGGLLFAMAAAALYLRVVREPLAPFFDRVAIGVGLTFALVRTGCFLAGCDYGLPTAHAWGVRFPPGSLAAIDHARRGFIPRGAASLPVHPTQLYEAAIGLLGAALAAVPVLRGRRDGRAFTTFLAVYAAGRFALEFLRGDQDRGHAFGLSTAQWVSVAIAGALLLAAIRRQADVRAQRGFATRSERGRGGPKGAERPTPPDLDVRAQRGSATRSERGRGGPKGAEHPTPPDLFGDAFGGGDGLGEACGEVLRGPGLRGID